MNTLSSGERPPLFDLCINLDNDQFDHDREEMLVRARNSGVPYLCLTGSSLLSSQYARLWASKSPSHFCATSGIHPHEAGKANEDIYNGIEALLDDTGRLLQRLWWLARLHDDRTHVAALGGRTHRI